VALGCVRLLRLAALLEAACRVGMWWALGIAFAEAGGTAEPLVPSVMGAASTSTRSQGRVAVRVEGDRARIVIEGPVILDLPTGEEADERLAIVLCRLLQGTAGKPLLTHQQIADAFGKGSRQACHNHMQQFDRVGSSLARMVLEGRPGRPSKLHPLVLERIVDHWERNPLATFGETCSWLATQQLGAEVALPTAEELGTVRRIGGNLVLMHAAVARLLERKGTGAALRPGLLLDRLFEVVDEQDRRLREAGIEPAPLGGALVQEVTAAGAEQRRLSRTGQILVTWLTRLTAPPSRTHDVELSEQVGTALLAPLHFGALYCLLGLSIGQVAALVGRSKSVVYRGLVALEQALTELDPFPAAANFSGVLAIDEKWVKIPKSFSEKQRAEGKKWRYAFFAVDALTGDLLHVELFETVDSATVRAFLVTLRAMGIRPKAVVTDMLAAYDQAIRDTFGNRVVHHFCLFHHLQAVRHRLRQRCGRDWKKEPLLRQLVEDIDAIYACKSRKTAKKRLAKVLELRTVLEQQHPEAVGILETLEQRFPLVANAIGRQDIPSTNNVTERTIKAFHRHYQHFAGMESLETARIQLRLFRHFYRLMPLREPAKKELRGLCVLERAGWIVRGIPLADYVRRFTEAWDEDGPELLVVESTGTAQSQAPGGEQVVEAQAA
jgi:transposase-like protein/transposase